MYKKSKLKNGVRIITAPLKGTNTVTVLVMVNTGSKNENAKNRGISHFLEHMFFKGTEKRPTTLDISKELDKVGGAYNAFTGKDMTSYYFEVDKNNWHPFVGILADCMQNARFDEQHLASEMLTVIQELKMMKDKYWNVMYEKASSLTFPSNHPYHCPIIGFKHDLAKLAAKNLKKFYKKYYGPKRATLFIVGDIDVNQAIEVAKQSFKDIKDESVDLDENIFIPLQK